MLLYYPQYGWIDLNVVNTQDPYIKYYFIIIKI